MDIFDIIFKQIDTTAFWEWATSVTGNIVSRYGFYIIHDNFIAFVHWKDLVIFFLLLCSILFLIRAQRRYRKIEILKSENEDLYNRISELRQNVQDKSSELKAVKMKESLRETGQQKEKARSEKPGFSSEIRMKNVSIDKTILVKIKKAVADSSELIIEYRNGKGEVSDRMICPLAIHNTGGRLYLDAWCYLRNAERSFRIDRISYAEPALQ